MLVRNGVRLSPRQADIYDLIAHAKTRGIPPETLAWVFFSDKPTSSGKKTAAVHINHINDMFASTDTRIKCVDGFYRVEKA